MLQPAQYDIIALEVKAGEALSTMDWEFDIDGTDDFRVKRGFEQLKQIEELLKKLVCENEPLVSLLWRKHCPYAHPNVLPIFLCNR